MLGSSCNGRSLIIHPADEAVKDSISGGGCDESRLQRCSVISHWMTKAISTRLVKANYVLS